MVDPSSTLGGAHTTNKRPHHSRPDYVRLIINVMCHAVNTRTYGYTLSIYLKPYDVRLPVSRLPNRNKRGADVFERQLSHSPSINSHRRLGTCDNINLVLPLLLQQLSSPPPHHTLSTSKAHRQDGLPNQPHPTSLGSPPPIPFDHHPRLPLFLIAALKAHREERPPHHPGRQGTPNR
jgi:hypothetical protein